MSDDREEFVLVIYIENQVRFLELYVEVAE